MLRAHHACATVARCKPDMLSSRFQNPSGAQMSAVIMNPMDSRYMDPNTVISSATASGHQNRNCG